MLPNRAYGAKATLMMGGPTFGDRVRIKPAAETAQSGWAGQFGEVLGESVPSGSGIDYGHVVGGTTEDYVLFVKLDSGAQSWFAASLVEFVDHQEGVVMTIEGGPTFRRLPDGTWQEEGGPTKVGEFLNPTGGVPRRTRRAVVKAFLGWLGGQNRRFDRFRK